MMGGFFKKFLLVCVIVFLLLPFLIGYWYRSQFYQHLDSVNEVLITKRLKLVLVDYQLGWLSSSVKLLVVPLTFDPRTVQILVDQDILPVIDCRFYHGPLIYDREQYQFEWGLMGLNADLHLAKQFEAAHEVKPNGVMQVHMLETFSGKAYQHIDVPPLNVQGSFAFQGLHVDAIYWFKHDKPWQVSFAGQVGKWVLYASSIRPSVPQIEWQPLSIMSLQVRENNGAWTGHGRIVSPGFMLDGAETLSLKDLTMEWSSQKKTDQQFDHHFQLSMRSLKKAEQEFSDLAAVNIDLSLKNIRAPLGETLQIINEFKRGNYNGIQNEMAQDFNADSIVDGHLSFNTPDGKFNLQWKAYWPPHTVFHQPDEVMKTQIIEARLSASKPLIDHWLARRFANIDAYQAAHPPVTEAKNSTLTTAAMSTTNMQPAEGAYRQQVAQYLAQGLISLPVSLQLLALADQHVTAPTFDEFVNQLPLKAEAAGQLKQQYSQMQTAQTQALKPNTAPPVNQAKAPAVSVSGVASADKAKQWLAAYVQQGLIQENPDEYVISIIKQGDTLKINGKEGHAALTDLINLWQW